VRARALAVSWLCVGIAVWCGFFDLYVSRGAREYGQRHAEYELHLTREEPSMTDVMSHAKRDGVIAASLWGAVIIACGWTTIWLRTPRRSRSHSRGSL
jgi:hypothetical protein